MRILIDECLPRKLRLLLVGHEAITVPQAGWAGLKNGQLLALAVEAFDVFITIDQNLAANHYADESRMTIIVLKCTSNELSHLVSLVPKVLEILSKAEKRIYLIED